MSSTNVNKRESDSNFVQRPGKGWLHSDEAINDGIIYNIKYIGCIGVNESMKSLSFEIRTQVARESIRRIAEQAKLINFPRRNKRNDDQLNRILSTNCNVECANMSVQLFINTQYLKITEPESYDVLFQHTMQNISFACGGDSDIKDFIAYVAKDEVNGRACYVFECANSLANSVITTIGQAFELRFRKFMNTMSSNGTHSTHAQKSNSALTSPVSRATSANKNSSSPTSSHENRLLHNQHQHHAENEIPVKQFSPTSEHLATPAQHKHVHANHHHNHQNHHQQQHNDHHPHHHQHHHHHHHMQFNSEPTQIRTTASSSINNQHHQFHTPMASSTASSSSSNAAAAQRAGQQVVLEALATNRKIDEKLEKMPWFHGLLTRENAEKLLAHNGDFLVRETNKVERQYVLSGRYKNECRHIFLVDPSGVVRTKDRQFDNICHLIQYHQENRIPIISKDNELLLENPIYK